MKELENHPAYHADVQKMLRQTSEWLKLGHSGEVGLRLAPSAICRSDALMLGLSVPRFGHRAHLGSDGSCFVNVRRRALLQEQVPPKWVGVSNDTRNNPVRFIGRQPLLADAVLTLPERFQRDWAVVTAELGTPCGEAPAPHTVPYARALTLSGTCAQAVVYMAAALLSDVATSALGLAEISALATEDGSGHVEVTSMGWGALDRVAEKLGLRMPRQAVVLPEVNDEDEAIHRAIHDYVQAGVPVLIPVRLTDFEKAGGYKDVTLKGKPDTSEHAFLAVGASHPGQPKRVLLMDPTTVPFLEVPVEVLTKSLCRVTDRDVPAGAPSVGRPLLIPVLPAAVKLGLLGEIGGQKSALRQGLLAAVHEWQRRTRTADPAAEPSPPASLFSLVRSELVRARLQRTPGKEAKQCLQRLEAPSTGEWVWLETAGSSSRIWMACPTPTIAWSAAKSGFLGSVPSLREPASKGRSRIVRRSTPSALEPAIITSVSAAGLEEGLKMLPKACRFADLYAFMGEDAVPVLGVSGAKTSVEAMASLADDAGGIERVAHAVCERVNRHKPGLVFRALASFVPEVAAADETKRETGQKALTFLARLAPLLNDFGHEIRAIEIVGGARIDSVWLSRKIASDRSGESLKAKLASEDKIFTRLARSLCHVIYATADTDIPFALELEPGPLYVLNSTTAMKGFFDVFKEVAGAMFGEGSPSVIARVGMNLDIAHLGLLGVGARELKSEAALWSRIVHAHISDYSRGHFADVVLGRLNSAEVFAEWIDELQDAAPRFSGTISMELEACANAADVQAGFIKLQQLLGQ